MTKTNSANKLERDLEHLEAAFLERLRISLRRCASGTWGLFGQNDLLTALSRTRACYESPDAEALMDMVAEIDTLRKRLGFSGTSTVCDRFIAYRNVRGNNVPGEPKLATRLLDELGEER